MTNSTTARIALMSIAAVLLVTVLASLVWALAAMQEPALPSDGILALYRAALTALGVLGAGGSVGHGVRHYGTKAPTSAMLSGAAASGRQPMAEPPALTGYTGTV